MQQQSQQSVANLDTSMSERGYTKAQPLAPVHMQMLPIKQVSPQVEKKKKVH